MGLVSNHICRLRVTSTDFVSPPFVSLLSEVPQNTKTQALLNFYLRQLIQDWGLDGSLAWAGCCTGHF